MYPFEQCWAVVRKEKNPLYEKAGCHWCAVNYRKQVAELYIYIHTHTHACAYMFMHRKQSRRKFTTMLTNSGPPLSGAERRM